MTPKGKHEQPGNIRVYIYDIINECLPVVLVVTSMLIVGLCVISASGFKSSAQECEPCAPQHTLSQQAPMFSGVMDTELPINENHDKPVVFKSEDGSGPGGTGGRKSAEWTAIPMFIPTPSAETLTVSEPSTEQSGMPSEETPEVTPDLSAQSSPPAVETEKLSENGDAQGTEEPVYIVTEEDIVACAKMLYGEARGCTTGDKQNCVRTVCNRCADPRWPDTICGVITQRNQYYGYSSGNPVTDELYAIAVQVINDWIAMLGGAEVEWYPYNCFSGNGSYNSFYTI